MYLRLNFSTPLCACPEPGDPCSASTLSSDNHSLRYQLIQGCINRIKSWKLYLETFIFRIIWYEINESRVKSSILSLELSFRSLLQGRQTSKWRFSTAWQFKIKALYEICGTLKSDLSFSEISLSLYGQWQLVSNT